MSRLLLHICCGPCAPHVFRLLAAEYQVTGFFYNPNIHPRAEFEFRRDELEKVARHLNWEVVYPEYDPERWRQAVVGLAAEPERGRRCPICFHFRLEKTFVFARDQGFDLVASTLSISPHKKTAQINAQGEKLALQYQVPFCAGDFKKQGGHDLSRKLALDLHIRHQHYCGCDFSLARSGQARGAGPGPSGLK